jgi:hypothetical protein
MFVGAQQVLNITMQVGQVTERVEVTGQAPTVQLASSALSAQVNATTVRELPLNGRDWMSLATLEPGINSLASSQPSLNNNSNVSARGIRGFGNQLSITGGRPAQNNYRIDGVSVNDYSNSSPGSVLGGAAGVDAVAEFSVITSNYSAEYGRTSGGVIDAITRSGTNQFHGDAYEFLRNSSLDARNFFDGAKIPPFRRNQFGASAGGPIRKDKTFVFGNYEGIRQALGLTAQDIVPSNDMRNGVLNFTDPSQFPTGCVATAIPNQCQVTVDPNIAPFLALWRPPNLGLIGLGNTGIYTFAGQQATTENFLTSRVDNKFSDKDSLAGSFQFDKATTTLPDALNDTLVGQKTTHVLVAVEESHIFSPGLVNTVRLGFNRSTAQAGGGISAINPASADSALSAVPGYDAPLMQPTGLTFYAGGLNSVNRNTFFWNSFQVYDDAFLTKGNHNLKFGFAGERMQDNYQQFARGGGLVGFGSLANFLTNIPSKFQVTFSSAIGTWGLRQTLAAGYVQDDIHWRPNLTVNAGLRYEMTTAPIEVNGRLGRLLNPTDTTVKTGNPFFGNPTLHNFEPRAGFAWDPFRDGKTSIRGGAGLFDVLPLAYEYANFANNSTPFAPQGNASNLPQGSFPALALTLVTQPGKSRVTYVEPNPHRNYVEQWNLSVQREITPSLTATLAYSGSHGVHMEFRADDMNGVVPPLTSAGYLFPSPRGIGTVVNPNFGRMDIATWGGSTSYNALQAMLFKRLSRGIQIQGTYTWSKTFDDGSGSYLSDPFSNSIPNLFWFDNRLRHALADYNVGQNLVINYTWILPSPKSLPSAATWALGGWELGGIFQARTGLPFTPVLGGDPLGYNTDDFDFPNHLAGPGCANPINSRNPTDYIKLNCYAPNSPLLLIGNAGRNSIIGPGMADFDFSLFKNSYVRRISETFNVQFRAEFFNIFNRANFNSPTNNNTLFDQSGVPVGGAGRIDSTSTSSREIQLALKLIW